MSLASSGVEFSKTVLVSHVTQYETGLLLELNGERDMAMLNMLKLTVTPSEYASVKLKNKR